MTIYLYERTLAGPFSGARARKLGKELAHTLHHLYFHSLRLERSSTRYCTVPERSIIYESSGAGKSLSVDIRYHAYPFRSDIAVRLDIPYIPESLDTIVEKFKLRPAGGIFINGGFVPPPIADVAPDNRRSDLDHM